MGGRCRGENIHEIIYSLHGLLDGFVLFVELVFVSCAVSVVTVYLCACASSCVGTCVQEVHLLMKFTTTFFKA